MDTYTCIPTRVTFREGSDPTGLTNVSMHMDTHTHHTRAIAQACYERLVDQRAVMVEMLVLEKDLQSPMNRCVRPPRPRP